MKNIQLIFALLFISNLVVAESDTLIISSKAEFDLGSPELVFEKDSGIIKKNGSIKLGCCKPFIDTLGDAYYCEFDYLGNLHNHFYIVKKTLYNGEEYIILNKNNTCTYSTLLGFPHISDSIIINFDESVTTDRQQIMELWKISNKGIKKIRNIPLSKNIQPLNVRFFNRYVIIKDIEGRYWKQDY